MTKSFLSSMCLYVQGCQSSGTEDTTVLKFLTGRDVTSRGMAEECTSQCLTVLIGRRSCDRYDQQGLLPSDYPRVIARFIYPTQCSKCLSGVLVFQFQSLI